MTIGSRERDKGMEESEYTEGLFLVTTILLLFVIVYYIVTLVIRL